MTINPKDYDLNELREMARKRGESPDSLGDTAAPDPDDWEPIDEEAATGSLRSELYRELLPLEAGDDSLEKPYLTRLPDNYAGEFLVFEWLEFLLMHAGYRGAREALDYYETIDWITEDVESELDDYALGLEGNHAESEELDMNDHMVSLVYVAKLVSSA